MLYRRGFYILVWGHIGFRARRRPGPSRPSPRWVNQQPWGGGGVYFLQHKTKNKKQKTPGRKRKNKIITASLYVATSYHIKASTKPIASHESYKINIAQNTGFTNSYKKRLILGVFALILALNSGIKLRINNNSHIFVIFGRLEHVAL